MNLYYFLTLSILLLPLVQGSKSEKPIFTVRQYDLFPLLAENKNITYGGSGKDSVITGFQQRYNVTCSSNNLIKYSYNIPEWGSRSQIDVQRWAADVFDLSTYRHLIGFYFSSKEGLSGSITCTDSTDPGLTSTLYIFAESGKPFINSGETLEIPWDGRAPPELIPCPSNYFGLSPTLEHRNFEGESFRPLKGVYDPRTGFIPPKLDSSKGEFRCSSRNDFVNVKFTQKSWNMEQSAAASDLLDIWQPFGDVRIVCFYGDLQNVDRLLDIQCVNPYECSLYRKCFDSESCTAPRLVGTNCTSDICRDLARGHPYGMLLCEAGNQSLVNYHFQGLDRSRYLTSQENIPQRALIAMDEIDPVLYTDQEVLFYCEAVQFFFAKEIHFTVVYANGTQGGLPRGTSKVIESWELSLSERKTVGAIHSAVKINVTEDMREVICMAPWYNSSTEWHTRSRKFVVEKVGAPEISKGNTSHLFYIGDEGRHLTCSADGQPYPQFKWFRSGMELNLQNMTGFRVTTSNGESVLTFGKIQESMKGVYSCHASNRLGNASVEFNVDVQEYRLSSWAIGGLTVGLLLVVTIATTLFLWMRRKYLVTKAKLRDLTKEEVYEFVRGNPQLLNAGGGEGNIQENAQFLPFNAAYEITEQDLVIDKGDVLGKGAFGIVYRGKFRDGTEVAIKTTLPTADVSYFKALLSEIKVMAYIGNHPNIVRFIGAITSDIRHRLVYVVVELSPLGDLEGYLKSHRTTYVNFVINDKIVKSELQYDNLFRKITTFDCIKWCHEISAGMEYLASRNVIHGDLATRNILLFDGDVAKITDFGLSRQIYENTNYTKKNQAPLPWRWMAIESLRDLEFSVKSDVWAFAVTAWEVFTMAELPYPGLSWSLNFIQLLENGMRMPKPKFATMDIYVKFLKCWEPDPSERPSFQELKEYFGMLLKDSGFEIQSTAIDLNKALYSNYCG